MVWKCSVIEQKARKYSVMKRLQMYLATVQLQQSQRSMILVMNM